MSHVVWFTNPLENDHPGHKELELFVDDLRSFLDEVLKRDEFRVLFDGDGDLWRMAQEAVNSGEMDEGFTELRKSIDSIEHEKMVRHGLFGPNLRFKLGVLGHISNEFPRRLSDQFSVQGWFQRIVAAIDALLDSMIDAAGGAGGLIKEFKVALGALAISRS
jgi:hypothetical protein